jgi:hypothetical protein
VTPPRPRPADERGVALLIVLVVLFIVAVLMVDITLTAATARRSARNASTDFLMDAALEGRQKILLAQLQYDLAANAFDSLDDRWARKEYTTYEAPPAEDGEGTGEEEEGVRVIGDSDEVDIVTTDPDPEKESPITDEESKFNLNLLAHPDAKERQVAGDRFAVLLDRFREGTPLDLTRTRAEELRDRVVDFLESRSATTEAQEGKLPVPRTAPWRLLTPDELRLVEGFEDPATGLTAEGILYDAREPARVKEYEEDPENVEPPEVHRGLLRFVTLWSGSAWTAADGQATWGRINVNTAEKPVLETLFWKNPDDFVFAEKIISHRKEPAEGSAPTDGDPEVDEPLETRQNFEKFEDLKKVEGLDDAVLNRNGITNANAVVVSETFSIDLLAKHGEASRQVRWIVRRHRQGFQTLLREVRADPRFEEKEPDEESAGE